MGEVKLKKTTPKVAPPPKEEPNFENELLAKLKKRQAMEQSTPPTENKDVSVDTPPQQVDTPPQKVEKQSPPVSNDVNIAI